jgi:hypothetical protein
MSSTRKGPSASSTSLVAPTSTETTLLLTRQHLDGRAQHLGRSDDEVVSVGRLANRLRGDRTHSSRAVRLDDLAILRERLERAGDAVGVEATVRSVERPRRVVTTRRSSVTEPARMSSRVEFVPQSMTATGTASEGTTRLRVRAAGGDQRPTGSSNPARKAA